MEEVINSSTLAVITSAVSAVHAKLSLELPVASDDIRDYNKYLKRILDSVKERKWIPVSLYRERADYQKRYERSLRNYARGDSFGDGMPRGQENPNSEYDKQIERLTLKAKLDDINARIESLDSQADYEIKDIVKELIELVPNEKHSDIMKLYYIYRESHEQIADETHYALETVKSYRKRGFETLANILMDFSKKIHNS